MNFPPSPSPDQTYTYQGRTWKYNGVGWALEADPLPAATTSLAGIVQLDNTYTSTSTTQAPTANALKSAYDALNSAKAPLDSPVFTGTPTAPTPDTADDSTQLATTAFVRAVAGGSAANLVINGGMTIDQRNRGGAENVTPGELAGTWLIDRWRMVVNDLGADYVSQQVGISDLPGFSTALRISVSQSHSFVGNDAQAVLFTRIEGTSLAHFEWGTASAQNVTLKFRAKSTLTGTYSVALGNSGVPINSAMFMYKTFAINAANTWQTVELTFPGPTSGTWPKGNETGLSIAFVLTLGSAYRGTAGADAWSTAATPDLGPVGGANFGTAGLDTFDITGVQLEAGDSCGDFLRRPPGEERALCQRYGLAFHPPSASSAAPNGHGHMANDNFGRFFVPTPVTMRAAPSVTFGFIGDEVRCNGEVRPINTVTSIELEEAGVNLNLDGLGFSASMNNHVASLSLGNEAFFDADLS